MNYIFTLSLVIPLCGGILFLLQRLNKLSAEKNLLQERINIATESFNVKQQEILSLKNSYDLQQEKIIVLSKDVAALNVENKNLLENKVEIESLQNKFKGEFENLASRILKDNSKELLNLNSKELQNILNPLKENMDGFKRQISESYDKDLRDRVSLKTEVKKLFEMNNRLSEEAHELSNALRSNNKAGGNWGEVILEGLLEQSGLVKGREYEVQERAVNSDNKIIQPDVTIYLPEDKHVIIDSKLSLIAYQEFMNSDDEEIKKEALKKHIKSVQNHILGLSSKEYYKSDKHNSLDFVLMFMPIDAAYNITVQHAYDIVSQAWDKKIVVVSPVTLHSTLRIIASLWKKERQSQNVMEIARQAGNLYDKFVGFLTDMQKIRKSLDNASGSYQEAMNKLQFGKGSLISRAENIKILGAKNSKTIPSELVSEVDNSLLEKKVS